MIKVKCVLVIGCLIILSCVLINTVYGLPATDPIVELAKGAPDINEYPKADAIILSDDQRVTVEKDGSSEILRHQVVKIITEAGKGQYANIRKRYDTNFQKLIVLKARTIKPDGTTLDVPDEAINEVTPWSLAYGGDAGIYANLKEKVISFTGLEKSCAIELKTKTISSRSYMEGQFWGEIDFQAGNPILERIFVLIIPEDMEFNYKILNKEIEPKVEKKDGTTTYTWEVRNVPQLTSEPYEPPEGDIVPYLMYSSVKDWDEIGKWYSELFYPQAKSDGSIKDKVMELTKGTKEREELIKCIFLYVTTKIRTLSSLQLGDVGYKPQPAVDVYKNKYGDCKDKDVLLVTMLKDAGIESYPVLIHREKAASTSKLCNEVPSPAQFRHVIVAVPQNGEYVWLDPSADKYKYGYLPYEDQTRECLIVMPNKYVMTRTSTYPLEQNLSHSITSIHLRSDGSAKGTIEWKSDGYFDLLARSRLTGITPEQERQYFVEAASSICEKTKLKDYHLSDLKDLATPSTISMNFFTPEYGILQKDLMILQLPEVPFEFANIAKQLQYATELQERQQRLMLDSQLMGKYEATVHIPKAYKVNTMPDELQINNAVGSLILTCKQTNEMIKYSLTLAIRNKNISPSEYPLLQELYTRLLSPKNSVLILERK